MNTTTPIADLKNLGPKSQVFLENAGITTLEQLRQLGSVAVFIQVKRSGANTSLNLLWALEGAITGVHWRVIAREHRTRLLLALDDQMR